MERNLTIDDLTQWILANRRGKAFLNWTAEDIKRTFSKAFGTQTASYTVDSEGNLCGVVLIELAPAYKIAHVSNILTTNKGAFKALWKKFMEWYPGWRLQGERHDNLKEFDVMKIDNKLQKLNR